jgi:hypothetical protein
VLVADLEAARRQIETLGLTVVDGGRHPGRGTANLIVPFGHQYLELLAVVDDAEARSSPQGRPVLDALARGGPGLARWSVECDTIEATAARLGLPVEHRQRRRPDGTVITWRSVAVDDAWDQSWRSAFMAWDDPSLHPARTDVTHPNGATGFARLDVEIPDEAAARHWWGGAIPSDVVLEVGDRPGVRHLWLSTPTGDVSIG